MPDARMGKKIGEWFHLGLAGGEEGRGAGVVVIPMLACMVRGGERG